jgi:signal transduction histidine kinase
LAGCPRADCLRRRLPEFLADPQSAAGLLGRLKRREVIHDHRVRLRRNDGAIRHCLVDADGLWEQGRLIHSRWFIRDVTRQVELEREILLVTEREQRRIGRDLHDDLCQQLTGIEFLSQSLVRRLSHRAPAGATRAREIAGMVRQAISHTRELAHGLSPVQLEAGSLTDALRTLSGRARKLFGLDCRFHCAEPFLNRDDALTVHLYRIAQEALANAVKHGKATRVDIRLAHNQNQVALFVTDNGTGLPANIRAGKGMGLRVMQYRAHVIGGTLRVERGRRGGTVVACTVKGDNGNIKFKRSA